MHTRNTPFQQHSNKDYSAKRLMINGLLILAILAMFSVTSCKKAAEVIGDDIIESTKDVVSVDKCDANKVITTYKKSKLTVSKASTKTAFIGNLTLTKEDDTEESINITGTVVKRSFLGVEMNALITITGKALIFKKVNTSGATQIIQDVVGDKPVISAILTTTTEILTASGVANNATQSLDQLYLVDAATLVKFANVTQAEGELAKATEGQKCEFILPSRDKTDRRAMIDLLYSKLDLELLNSETINQSATNPDTNG